MKDSWRILSIVAAIAVAASAVFLTFETPAGHVLPPGSGALIAGTPTPDGGREKVTIDSLSDSTKELVDKIIAQLMSQGLTPGVELSVQKDGKTIYEAGYGTIASSGPQAKVVPGSDTRFQIDSLTKTFTAITILRLVEQGKIDLDQPIGKYLPGLPNLSWNAIPVRSYLGMITGIPDHSETTGTFHEAIATVAAEQTSYGTGLDFEPGSKYEYSDTNYFILGELVNAVIPHQRFMPFTKANVLEPLGMTDTGFIPFGTGDLWPTPYNNCNLATPAANCVAVLPRKWNAGFTGGGFVSTMSDLEKYAIGLYHRAILSEKSYKEMWKPTKLTSGRNKNKPVNFGLGWENLAFDSNKDLLQVGKNGGGWGWGSQLTLFPQRGGSVILLRNSNPGGNLFQATIDIQFAVAHPHLKPAITAGAEPNTCGGTLVVQGSGFLPNEQVSITVKHAPGFNSPQNLGVLGKSGPLGNVTIHIPYSLNPASGLPGCAFSSTATTSVTIIATGEISGETSTEFYLRNCGIAWGACAA